MPPFLNLLKRPRTNSCVHIVLLTMWGRNLLLLCGVVVVHRQSFAVDPCMYVGELLVESNVSLATEALMQALSGYFTLNTTGGPVIVQQAQLIAECLLVGDETTCNCTKGYIWSNEVCYNANCCGEAFCYANVSFYTPLCVPQCPVKVYGSITLNSGLIWNNTKLQLLTTGFQKLNGFKNLNITVSSLNFEVGLIAVIENSKLATTLTDLESGVLGKIFVSVLGMVSFNYPNDTVDYESKITLNCTFKGTDSFPWTWTLISGNSSNILNIGSLVTFPQCGTSCSIVNKSCSAVEISKALDNWAGTYLCNSTNQSISYVAYADVKVALLPDPIILSIYPLTVDCSAVPLQNYVSVKLIATVMKTSENYNVQWFFVGSAPLPMTTTFVPNSQGLIEYTANADISCTPSSLPITVTFTNQNQKQKSASIDIPVIYPGSISCDPETIWPKTPDGNTVIIRDCDAGRSGYKERTCQYGQWFPELSYCVKAELNQMANVADYFAQGLGATQDVALEIFSGLNNSTKLGNNDFADLTASIGILNIMSSASNTITLEESVLPNFMGAASDMLNQSWAGANKSVQNSMGSKYLSSIEGLVQNINVNTTDGLNTTNLQLRVCRARTDSVCNQTVFGVEVSMPSSTGVTKSMGMQNLVDKLTNNYPGTQYTSILVSTTVDPKNSSLHINLNFPMNQELSPKAVVKCVFWNFTSNSWSSDGCKWVSAGEDNRSICECSHLTSFSTLMSKSLVTLPFLDAISNICLGVSICSLLVFLFVEALVWSVVVKTNLSHFRHTALVNIALCLLLGYCSFLAASVGKFIGSMCLAVTVCQHFFFLAMFCWMTCLSVMLVHQLIFVFSPLRKRVYMFMSTIVGYIFPSVIVGSSYVYYRFTQRPYYIESVCWLTYDGLLRGSIHAFLLPVGTFVLVNLFSMGVVIVTLVKASAPEGSKGDDKETAKSIIRVIIFLTPVFGVTWVLGYFVFVMNDLTQVMAVIVNYAFTIINGLQGLFILVTGCFGEPKVRQELYKLIMSRVSSNTDEKNDSTKKLTTSVSTM